MELLIDVLMYMPLKIAVSRLVAVPSFHRAHPTTRASRVAAAGGLVRTCESPHVA